MEIKIKVDGLSDEQAKGLKEFGLNGIFKDAMRDIQKFNQWMYRFTPGMVARPLSFVKRRTSELQKPLSTIEIKHIEDKATRELQREVIELFETRKKSEILRLVLRRLSPHSLALLVKE